MMTGEHATVRAVEKKVAFFGLPSSFVPFIDCYFCCNLCFFDAVTPTLQTSIIKMIKRKLNLIGLLLRYFNQEVTIIMLACHRSACKPHKN
mmetsp:Transcript_23641/g.33178  ORF Transcript_23641/g.33178 Transcript_23641/m.33178 type:complete len:91 (+) Transcript_23641:2432-2704(+)